MRAGVERHALRQCGVMAAVLVLLCSVEAFAGPELDWLASQQNVDGSYGDTPASLATPSQTTSEVLRAQLLLDQALLPGFESAFTWLDSRTEVHAELLARRLTVTALAGRPTVLTANALLSLQTRGGGFSHQLGFAPSVRDTAMALEALAAANQGATPQASRAVAFLLSCQLGNGGWAEGVNEASPFLSAVALRSLWPYRAIYGGVAAALTRAQGFLWSRRGTDGLWGEDFVSAHALLALVPTVSEAAVLDPAVAALKGHQAPDGSWGQDAYTTALVLQALKVHAARQTGETPAPTGSVAGYVVRAHGTEPLPGVTVAVGGAEELSVTTNADGYFLLPHLPPGAFTLTASRAGFLPASVVVEVQPRQVTLAGRLALDVATQTGLVAGSVVDSVTRQPLSSVQVVLQGPTSRAVLTDARGDFDFGPVTPGTYALGFQKAGYRAVSGEAVVVAGGRLEAHPALTPDDVPVEDGPGAVSGRVVDGKTGLPLAGARFALSASQQVLTGPDGTFALASVPRGSYAGTLSASGYQSLTFSLMFSPGASGALGVMTLFPVDVTPAPTRLTLRGSVTDGVKGTPVAQAHVTLTETGQSVTTGADGRFVLADLTLQAFNLAVAAPGYAPATYAIQVGAYGEAVVELKLSPPGSSATTSTLSGLVTDAAQGLPLQGARVAIAGTALSALTGPDGAFSLSGIPALEFTVEVSAVGHAPRTVAVQLVAHGGYTLDSALEPVSTDGFQVVSLEATQPEAGANGTVVFTARIASLLGAPQSVLVLGVVQDAAGTEVASVTPYAVGTEQPASSFSFAPGEEKTLTVPWKTVQFSPGVYRLVLRVVEPGTVTRALPTGEVLAEAAASSRILPTSALSGAMSLSPPLTQAGVPTPVAFTALLRNAGNVPLAAGAYSLTVVHPDTSEVLYTAQATAAALPVGGLATVSLGSFTPLVAGNLQVRVRPQTPGVAGEVTDRLYVGDKATGSFTVSRTVVPEGTQTVRGHIGLQGVDTAQGGSTDPLFAFVKEAVRRGGEYTAPQAEAWHRANRCLGCHIQTQSLLGLASSFDKAPVDRRAATSLYNNVSTSPYADGALRISHPEFTRTQTTLGLWSLSAWPDVPGTFRAKYRAARFLFDRRQQSGDRTWFTPDYGGYWFGSDVGHTALTVKGFANLLKDATRPDMAAGVTDYALVPVGSVSTGANGVVDLATGPDGTLYALKSQGVIDRLDLVTGAATTVVTGLPTPVSSLSLAADGTFFVTRQSNPTVIKVRGDGTRDNFFAGGYLTDGALGPDGWLYAPDYYGQRVLRVSPTGQVETYAQGGLFSYPQGVAFDAEGRLLVANASAYNLLQVAADRTVSVKAEGLAYTPQRMVLAPDGSVYVLASQPYSEGVLRVRPDGSAERVAELSAPRALAFVGERLLVAAASGAPLRELQRAPLDTSALAAFRAEVPRAVRYLLASHQDNSTDNLTHALRMMGLAEARPVLDDSALLAQVEAAITYEANLLRSRQRADGGWGRYVGQGSDPLVAAMVGIALEYTEPSPTDPQIRRIIQYLLATQRADGSWDNVNNGLSTRLASTSFVMVFMPKALERLGGLDVDLHVELPATVALSNPTVAPTTAVPGPDGSTAYTWKLLGVTHAGRDVDFDLTLHALALGEARPVALRAELEFKNSFLEETVKSPLDVPTVRAASGLTLAIAAAPGTAPAHTPVALSATVTNTGLASASGQVALVIRAAGSTEPTATLPPLMLGELAPGAQRVLPTTWDTGDTLAGPYEVHGRLLDAQGRVVAEGVAPLRITAPEAVASTALTTDKPVYGAWDAVRITGRVANVAPNALLAPSKVEVTVRTPGGAVLATETRDVHQLMPGTSLDLPFPLTLHDAASGTYPVTLTLKDALTRQVLSTRATTFQVERRDLDGLTGGVTVALPQVSAGVPNTCTDTVRSLSASGAAGVTLVRQVLALGTGAVVAQTRQTVDLVGTAPHVEPRMVATAGLATGDYACALQAEGPGGTRSLGFAPFRVEAPAVRLEASLTPMNRGRLLVLLDAPVEGSGHDNDTYGPTGAPGLLAQKAFLETLLTQAGWAYTLIQQDQGEKRFGNELRTGGYTAYALFTEFFTLNAQVQKELREAVFRGEGLLIAGDHDARNKAVQDALGVRYSSTTVSKVERVMLDAAEFPLLSGELAVLASERPLRVERVGAQRLGTYVLAAGTPLPPTPLEALTLNSYGEGDAGFAGMDLLAIATRDGQASLAADVLRALLERVRPGALPTGARAVVPLRLEVTNPGIAVPVTTGVALPPGAEVVDAGGGQVQGGTVRHAFALAAGETKQVRLWVRLPPEAGPAVFQAVVEGTLGGPPVTVTASTTLPVTAPPSLPSIRAQLNALVAAGHPASTALKKASALVGMAIAETYPDLVIEDVTLATDALLPVTDAQGMAPRVALGTWLRHATLGKEAPH
ncbi:carboxypeptidase regulatory-like domain-containing protein [Corallococcus macrosporus]|uniref:Carboxypeptidase regulatory-like domain-containing protein n=1 Tax=Corallococcus macrosporus TaxID=35 RepID=A0ABS3DPV9_9BACT|nr:carboxypeptidase regulatory-like domain-containing protein [Corallococcus macrosporus]MBN8233367.1 carboxypeptidase regulatory-like domain-containing protein [Corallococcus macrosporus]